MDVAFMAQSDQNGPKIIFRHESFFPIQNDFLKELREFSDIFFCLKNSTITGFFRKITLWLKVIKTVPKSFLDMKVFFPAKMTFLKNLEKIQIFFLS